MRADEYYRYYLHELQQVYSLGEATAIAGIIFESKVALTRMDILESPQQILSPEKENILQQALQQLLQQQPVQYVTGEAWFYQLPFKVNEQVLIPRPETEELAKWIIDDHLQCREKNAVLDIGTGSGCIAVTLKKNLHVCNITGIDISTGALTIARQNAESNGTAIDFIQTDFLDEKAWKALPVFDVMVSNPPYIPVNEKENLNSNVTAYEPHTALFVPDQSPLLFYEKIASFAQEHLREAGKIYVEIHQDYADATAAVFSTKFRHVEIRKDINGNERMIKATNSLR